jgi:hypothetical protein
MIFDKVRGVRRTGARMRKQAFVGGFARGLRGACGQRHLTQQDRSLGARVGLVRRRAFRSRKPSHRCSAVRADAPRGGGEDRNDPRRTGQYAEYLADTRHRFSVAGRVARTAQCRNANPAITMRLETNTRFCLSSW